MCKLPESSDDLTAARAPGHTAAATSRNNRKISEFWRHAKRLHEALSGAWQCGRIDSIANLGLEHRTSGKVEFDVLFRLGVDEKIRNWHGTKIKMVANANTSSFEVPTPNASSNRSRVRFSVTSSQESAPELTQTGPIKDLRSALGSNHLDCIGFLEADEHRFVLYPGNRNATVSNVSTVSLHDLLGNVSTLTRRKRCSLAVTLASSYLQLCTTPWLDTYLRKESIVFVRDMAEPQSTQLEHPYIRQEVSKSSDKSAMQGFLSLGIRLLELCFGTPIEDISFRKQLPAGDAILSPLFDYTAAIQWSRLVGEEAGPEFAEATEGVCMRRHSVIAVGERNCGGMSYCRSRHVTSRYPKGRW